MLTALDLYLSTAPLAELATHGVLALLALGLAPFAVGNAVDHALVARRSVRGL